MIDQTVPTPYPPIGFNRYGRYRAPSLASYRLYCPVQENGIACGAVGFYYADKQGFCERHRDEAVKAQRMSFNRFARKIIEGNMSHEQGVLFLVLTG